MVDLALGEEQLAAIVQELRVVHLARHAAQLQVRERIGEQVNVQALAVLALREAAVRGHTGEVFRLGHGTAIDGAGIVFHPVSVHLERGLGAGVEIAARGGAHVHQQVSAQSHGVHQHADEHFRRFPGGFIAVIAPGAGERLAGFPHHELAGFLMAHPFQRLILLGRPQILLDFRAVVDHDARLQLARQGDQLFGLPIVLALALHPFLALFRNAARIGKIEPQHVDLAIVGEQLAHLVAHVFGVHAHVAVLALLVGVGIVAAGMVHIDGDLREVPVEQRIVKTDVQALGAEGVNIFAHQVAARGRVGALIIGILGVPHAEAFVVLGGEHGVFHARGLGLARPFARVEQVGIEILEVFVVLFLGNLLAHLDPFVAGRHGIQPPVDEHAEAVVREPGGVARRFARYVAGHFHFPPFLVMRAISAHLASISATSLNCVRVRSRLWPGRCTRKYVSPCR